MRIAVWHNFPSGGGKRALHDHVRGLVTRGHYVESWSPPTADLSYMPLSRYSTEHIVPFDYQPGEYRGRIGGIFKPYRDVVAKIEAMKRHAQQCAAEIDRGGFDLILGNSCCCFASSFLARYASVPTVLYLQEPYREFYEALTFEDMARLQWVAPLRPYLWSGSPLRWKKRAGFLMWDLVNLHAMRLQAREECLNVHAFDRVLCNSRFSYEAIRRVYRRDSRVCYLGIDTDAFRPTGAPKERYVVGLGSFEVKKGIDRAVHALATIDPSLRPSLVWIGNFANASYLEEVKALAASLSVDLLPRQLVGQDELVALLSRAAVLVYTSRLEPFGYAPLEANACGTSVVGIAEGGIRESIEPGSNGILVEADDDVALGQALARYVNDLDWARDEGLRARDHVTGRWRLEAAVDRLEMHLVATLQAGYQTGIRRGE